MNTHRTALHIMRTTRAEAGQQHRGITVKINFLATYHIDGNAHNMKMEYDTKDVEKTLERRLKTAFPNASGITIVLDTPRDTAAAAPAVSQDKPRGAR